MPVFLPFSAGGFEGSQLNQKTSEKSEKKKNTPLLAWGALFSIGLVAILFFLYPSDKRVYPQILHIKNIHKDFSGRGDILSKMEKVVDAPTHSKEDVTVIGLWGEGGVGKSELAIAFSNFKKDHFAFIWWIECDSKVSYDQNYKEIAKQLSIPFGEKEHPKIIRQRVHHFLENSMKDRPWLLVYDNVDKALEFPQRGNGTILLTTRNQDYTRPYHSIQVEPFSLSESIQLIEHIVGKLPHEAEKIAEELGFVPLAINQAAHYIARSPKMSGQTYLEIFKKNKQAFARDMQLDTRYSHGSLISSWKVTSEYLLQECPEALWWLQIMAYLSPDQVPVSWIDKWLQVCHNEQSELSRKMRVNQILSTLNDLALIRYDGLSETLSIHRLRQEILALEDQNSKQTIRETFQLFFGVFEGKNYDQVEALEKDRSQWEQVYYWELSACHFLDKIDDFTKYMESADLLDIVCSFRTVKGDFSSVVKYRKKALLIRERLTETDPKTIASIDNLAWALCRVGEYYEAEKLFLAALKTRLKTFGNDTLEVATCLHGIGYCLERRGLYLESIEYEEKAVKLREKHLGTEHYKTAYSYDALAWVLEKVGRYKEAEYFARKGLKIRRDYYGEGHPLVASSKHHLAWVLQSIGKYHLSEEIHREALKRRQEIFGKNHPSVINSIQYLAWVLGEQGKYAEAERSHREVIEVRKKLLGENHPETVRTNLDLAWALRHQGKYNEAKKLYEIVIDVEEKREGGNSYEVANAKYGLSRVLEKQGECEKSLSVLQEVIAIRKSLMGEEEIDIDYYTSGGHHLPVLLSRLGRTKEAYAKHEEAFQIRKEHLGEDHPKVYTSRYHLGSIHAQLGELEKAISFFEEVVKFREQFYGQDHPYVATVLNELGKVYSQKRFYGKAKWYLERALSIRVQNFGQVHPYVATSLDELAKVMLTQGNTRKAMKYMRDALSIRNKTLGFDHPLTSESREKLKLFEK